MAVVQEQDAVERWIVERKAESDVYTVRSIISGEFLGLLILAKPPGVSDIHLGYLFAETAWGNGYATELLRGVVTVAKANKSGRSIKLVAGVERDNAASIRVLEKAGFDRAEGSDVETDTYFYLVG